MFKLLSQLQRWAEHRHGPRHLGETMEALQDWPKTAIGASIIGAQQQQLDKLLQEVFGYHLLEMSCFCSQSLTDSSPINHRFKLSPSSNLKAQGVCEFEHLPLPSESIDTVLLHHVLEFSPNPHQILRESSRVLVPHGHMIIIGFNPWSLQGLYKLCAQWITAGDFWCRRSLRAGRVMDWLQLLDCEPTLKLDGFYGLPINKSGILKRLRFLDRIGDSLKLPWGGYYLIVARKEHAAVIPSKPVWKSLRPVGLIIGEPSARMPKPLKRPATAAKQSHKST